MTSRVCLQGYTRSSDVSCHQTLTIWGRRGHDRVVVVQSVPITIQVRTSFDTTL
jgi:hypothetical protein